MVVLSPPIVHRNTREGAGYMYRRWPGKESRKSCRVAWGGLPLQPFVREVGPQHVQKHHGGGWAGFVLPLHQANRTGGDIRDGDKFDLYTIVH